MGLCGNYPALLGCSSRLSAAAAAAAAAPFSPALQASRAGGGGEKDLISRQVPGLRCVPAKSFNPPSLPNAPLRVLLADICPGQPKTGSPRRVEPQQQVPVLQRQGAKRYDFVEVEEPSDGTILGRWCGSTTVPGKQISKGNQIRIRFVSDEYFPSEPGFCIHYTLLVPTESASPTILPPSALPLELLNNAVAGFSTVEELIKYLEPDRWQLDLEDLYRPTWQLLGKAYIHGRKSRVVDLNLLKEEVRMYSCTPRNYSVSLREELKRTDTIFWPLCLLVKRCGGNCGCCQHACSECQCVPTKVTKKYHEVLQLKPRSGVKGLHKSLTDVPLDHHEECDCVCKGNTEG
uniref:Platelet-derived growth factor C n=1 Tax=Podarcis muralis TaxID=64176 RepID=A0A670J2F4_PODMU